MTEETIFTDALERSAGDERKAFLDEACRGDTALRQQVETLLKSHVEAGSFLGAPVPECLAKELKLTEPAAAAAGEPRVDDDGQSLNFLTPSDKPDSLGRLGSYEVQEVIGRGGMGIVLRAFDEKLHRVVAIKVMTAPLASNATARKRFTREARSAAAVSHDHVVTIHEVEETSDLPYLVMQYVSGVSLQERLDKSGPLQLHEILRIGMQAATGLAAAHAQGLVHRDIKPANILLENGVERVKITDFGLAHAVDDVRTTQPGTVIGTPEYMSPEQARGEKVDHRSDLFNLGCVLYSMCAGRPPFRAESTVAIIRRVCDDTPRALTEINPEIPEWLADIIDKLIAKNANERFQSAAEVADLLGQYLAHVQQPAVNPQPAAIAKLHRVPGVERSSTPIWRRQWAIAAAIVLLLATSLALAESTGVTTVAATVVRIVRGDGTLVVEIDDPNIQVLLNGEELVITGAGPKELRLRPGQHELQTVKGGKPADTKLITITRDGRQVVKVAREAPPATSPAGTTTRMVWDNATAEAESSSISPDGRYLAFVNWGNGDLTLRDLATGKNRSLTNKGSWAESGEFAMLPRFSTDGKRLAFTWYNKERKTDLRVISVDGGEPQVFLIDANDKEAYGWTPDGRSILVGLYTTRDATLQLTLIDVTDGSHQAIKSLRGKVGRFSLSPDGRTVAYSRVVEPGSANRDIFLIDIASGQETRATTHVTDTDVLGWVPDGQRLLVTMQRQGTWDAWTIRTADGKPQGEPQLVKADLGTVTPLGFTRDGAFYYGLRYGGPNLYTAALDLGKGTATATPLPTEKLSIMDQLFQPTWSPDGRYLAYKANRPNQIQEIRIVPVAGGPTRVLQHEFSFLNSFRWSPDGQSFVSVAQKKVGQMGIYQIDASTGNATTVVEPRDKNPILVAASPRWSPDGRGIFYNRFGIVYRDIQAQTERKISIPGDSVLANPIFDVSPDGRQLAVWGKELNTDALVLRLVPVDGGASRDLLRVNERAERGWVSWTPDGKYVLFTRYGADEKDGALWYISANGGNPWKFALSGVEGKAVQHISVHPDGRQLAFTVVGTRKSEIWALENFLPPLDDSKRPAAANASDAKSK